MILNEGGVPSFELGKMSEAEGGAQLRVAYARGAALPMLDAGVVDPDQVGQ